MHLKIYIILSHLPSWRMEEWLFSSIVHLILNSRELYGFYKHTHTNTNSQRFSSPYFLFLFPKSTHSLSHPTANLVLSAPLSSAPPHPQLLPRKTIAQLFGGASCWSRPACLVGNPQGLVGAHHFPSVPLPTLFRLSFLLATPCIFSPLQANFPPEQRLQHIYFNHNCQDK